MPTVIEVHEPEAQSELYIGKPPIPVGGPQVSDQPIPARVLFSDSLLESGVRERKCRSFATTVSFAFQCVLIGFMLIVPLMFTEALPTQQLLTWRYRPYLLNGEPVEVETNITVGFQIVS
jgi:hypothetical protein